MVILLVILSYFIGYIIGASLVFWLTDPMRDPICITKKQRERRDQRKAYVYQALYDAIFKATGYGDDYY